MPGCWPSETNPRHRSHWQRRAPSHLSTDRHERSRPRPDSQSGFRQSARPSRDRPRRPHDPGYSRPIPGRCRCGVPGMVRPCNGGCASPGADCETRPTSGLPLRSAPDCAPVLPAGQPGCNAARGNRADYWVLWTGVDIPAARNVRCKCPALVGAEDSRGQRGALALRGGANRADP